MITYEDFKKVELKVAKILSAERVEGSDKLIKLSLELGSEQRQIVAGIGKTYEPESLVGLEIAVVTNLEPRALMGIESNGMLLAASAGDDGEPVLIIPQKEIPPGAEIK
jgi:methionine--tRNA ligase beta chain